MEHNEYKAAEQDAREQWSAPRPPMTSEDGLTAEFMHAIWRDGIIGYKEFRSWLANSFSSYAAVRDPGVDAMIDGIGRDNFNRAHEPEPEEETDSES